MYKVAVCDDENLMLDYLYNKIAYLFDERNQEYELYRYNSGDVMLDAILNKQIDFDAIFLDIEMDTITGLEVANEITSRTDKINIVFVTNRDDLVFDAINYRPFSFIRKMKLNEELETVIDRLIEKSQKEHEFYEIEVDKKKVRIKLRDIIYIESKGHYLYIRCVDREYKIRGKMFDYEIKLNASGFVRIHIAYLVNVRHISFVKYDGVSLDNDEVLPISRKKFEDTKNKHLEYVRKWVHGDH